MLLLSIGLRSWCSARRARNKTKPSGLLRSRSVDLFFQGNKGIEVDDFMQVLVKGKGIVCEAAVDSPIAEFVFLALFQARHE